MEVNIGEKIKEYVKNPENRQYVVVYSIFAVFLLLVSVFIVFAVVNSQKNTGDSKTATKVEKDSKNKDNNDDNDKADRSVEYVNKKLGVKMMVPASWKQESTESEAFSGTTFSTGDDNSGLKISLQNILGHDAFCSYDQSDVKIKEEKIAIGRKVESLSVCYYKDKVTQVMLLLQYNEQEKTGNFEIYGDVDDANYKDVLAAIKTLEVSETQIPPYIAKKYTVDFDDDIFLMSTYASGYEPVAIEGNYPNAFYLTADLYDESGAKVEVSQTPICVNFNAIYSDRTQFLSNSCSTNGMFIMRGIRESQYVPYPQSTSYYSDFVLDVTVATEYNTLNPDAHMAKKYAINSVFPTQQNKGTIFIQITASDGLLSAVPLFGTEIDIYTSADVLIDTIEMSDFRKVYGYLDFGSYKAVARIGDHETEATPFEIKDSGENTALSLWMKMPEEDIIYYNELAEKPAIFGAFTDNATSTGLEGVSVRLFEASGEENTLVYSAVTDKFGSFSFSGEISQRKKYIVEYTLPDGYVVTSSSLKSGSVEVSQPKTSTFVGVNISKI